MTGEEFCQEWLNLTGGGQNLYHHGRIIHHPAHGPQIRVNCPYCHRRNPGLRADTRHHLHISLEKERYYCMRCTGSGSVQRLLGNNEKIEVVQPTEFILEIKSHETKVMSPGTTISLNSLPPHHIAWRWLEKERFNREEILQIAKIYPIHYCVKGRQMTDNLANTTEGRLIFGIREGDKTIGWQARWIPTNDDLDQKPPEDYDKYLTMPGFSRKTYLYNWDIAKHWDTIVVLEGIKKVWKAGPFAVGLFGLMQPPDINRAWAEWAEKLESTKANLVFLMDRNSTEYGVGLANYFRKRNPKKLSVAISMPSGAPDDLDGFTRSEAVGFLKEQLGGLPQIVKTK